MATLGYDAAFLDADIAPPQTSEDDRASQSELAYLHFSVRMNTTRKLAAWAAWNIDGLKLFPSDSISRSGERFKLDPRIPASSQTGEAAYADNDLDRGHIARRSDLLWGTTLAEAKQANSDSFFFTNITPQHQDFNQSGRGGTWGLLENAVLAQDGLEDRRLTVFAGPVLAETDPLYRDMIQLPVEHWKVVVYRLDGRLKFKAFVLTQDLGDIGERAMPNFLEDFDTYLVQIDLLEERTGLTFPSLREHGPSADLRPTALPVLIEDVEQVRW